MITEDYVSFETAKLLKEKGFDIDECEVHYDPLDHTQYDITLQMAMKWLMEGHNLAITTFVTVDGWRSGVSQIKMNSDGFIVDVIDGIDDGNIPNCDTRQEACEAAIKYCLENLI